jgi:hypothetical protein
MIGARVFPRVRRLNPSMFRPHWPAIRDVKRSSVVLNRGCPGIVSYFGVHGMTKELQRSAKNRPSSQFFHTKRCEVDFASDCTVEPRCNDILDITIQP